MIDVANIEYVSVRVVQEIPDPIVGMDGKTYHLNVPDTIHYIPASNANVLVEQEICQIVEDVTEEPKECGDFPEWSHVCVKEFEMEEEISISIYCVV